MTFIEAWFVVCNSKKTGNYPHSAMAKAVMTSPHSGLFGRNVKELGCAVCAQR